MAWLWCELSRSLCKIFCFMVLPAYHSVCFRSEGLFIRQNGREKMSQRFYHWQQYILNNANSYLIWTTNHVPDTMLGVQIKVSIVPFIAEEEFPGDSAMQETWVWSLGWEDSLEKGTATHFSILAWRIRWTEEPQVLYSPWGRKESDTTEQVTHICIHSWGNQASEKVHNLQKATRLDDFLDPLFASVRNKTPTHLGEKR